MARDDRQQYPMLSRQNQPEGLTRYPLGEGADLWNASPFQMMRRMQEEMDRVFGSFFGQPWSGAGAGPEIAGWAPRVDVYDTDKEIIVKADLPGVEPEDLEVYATSDALVLRGETRREDERREGGVYRAERSYGRFERQIPLPPGTRPEEVRANYRNGVLELRVPKTEEARQRVRRIPIGGVSGAKGGEAGTPIESATAAAQGKSVPGPKPAEAAAKKQSKK